MTMKELTLVKNLMFVSSVGKPSFTITPFKDMNELIPERSLMNVISVVNPFHVQLQRQEIIYTVKKPKDISKEIKEHILERKPCECNQNGKVIFQISTFQIHRRIYAGEKPYECYH